MTELSSIRDSCAIGAYLGFHLASTVVQTPLPGDIYLMSPGVTASCHFRRVMPAAERPRRSPEFLALQDRLVIYYVYTRSDGRTTLYVADTGL